MSRTLFIVSTLLFAACDCAAGGGGTTNRQDSATPDSGASSDSSSDGVVQHDSRATRDVGASDDECGNGLDDDNDGQVDEACGCTPGSSQACYRGDPTLAGEGSCIWGTQRCDYDFEFSEWGPCVGDGAPEDETCDRIDNNCDGVIDEGCACHVTDLRDCYSGPAGTEGSGLCVSGFERCFDPGTGPEWSGCTGDRTPGEEDCDGGDEDCDGLIDEGCACTTGDRRDCYGGPPDTRGEGLCRAGRQTCSGDAWSGCAGAITPTVEICNGGSDEDCDGAIDCDDTDCDCCSTFQEAVRVEPAEGELFLVVDRSGSMQWPAVGTSRSRWAELESAMGSVLPMLSETPMGLLTFPEMNGTDERLHCGVAGSPDVPIAARNGATVSARLMSAAPRAGDTPTPNAIMAATSYLSGRASSRTPFVILATDGLPEANCSATVAATVSAIRSLHSSGIETFVIGFVGPTASGDTSGIPALRDALNQFADAGGTARPGARRYYEAVDGPALTGAMRSILGAATGCSFELRSAPPPGAEVRQDTTAIPASGYRISGRTIEFTGAYCERIREGLVEVISVRLSCP